LDIRQINIQLEILHGLRLIHDLWLATVDIITSEFNLLRKIKGYVTRREHPPFNAVVQPSQGSPLLSERLLCFTFSHFLTEEGVRRPPDGKFRPAKPEDSHMI